MTTICLPRDWRLDLYAGLLMVLICRLILLCPLSPGAKTAGIVVIGLWMGLLRRRYLLNRPVTLRIDAAGRLLVEQTDDRQFQVSGIVRGVISPLLISVRLSGNQGEFSDLFLLPSALDAEAHWQLRRALIGFKRPQGEGRRGT